MALATLMAPFLWPKIKAFSTSRCHRSGTSAVSSDVFPKGADGKLHPLPSWRTTGPFDFETWAHEIDLKGVGQDLSHIADGVLSVEGVKAAGDAFLDALGPGVRRAVERGIFGPGHGHHSIPKFLGGAAKQDLADLAPPIHKAFHKELTAELRKAGSPPVGGKTGSTEVWAALFKEDPAKKDLAHQILQRVTRNFDIERGTSITPNLQKVLGAGKPRVPPPAK